MGLEPLSRTQMISALKSVLPDVLPSLDSSDLEKLSDGALISLYNGYCNGNLGRFDEFVKSEVPNGNDNSEKRVPQALSPEEYPKPYVEPYKGVLSNKEENLSPYMPPLKIEEILENDKKWQENQTLNPATIDNQTLKSPLAYLDENTISKLFNTKKYDEIKMYIKLNNPSFANKKGVQVGNEWFDFDEKGRVERIYAEKPNGLAEYDANSFAIICYDDNDNVKEYITYLDKKGGNTTDGTKIMLKYNNYGDLKSIHNLNKKDSKYITETSLYVTNEIDNCKSFDDLLDLMNKTSGDLFIRQLLAYQIDNNTTIYEKIIDINDSNSFDNIIEKLNTTYAEYVYIDDIIDDMKSHSNDYNKLSVDIMRIMNRGINEGNHNESVRLNKEFDEIVEQGRTGDCWLIGSLLSYTDPEQNPNGLKIIKSLVKYNYDNHTATVKLKGAGKTYTFSFDEIQKSNHLSSGEDDMRVMEIALDKYRRDLAYNGTPQHDTIDIDGGETQNVINVLYKQEIRQYNSKNIDVALFNKKNTINTFSLNTVEYDNVTINNSKNNQELEIYTHHMYNIVMSDSEYVYFVNPHKSKQEDITDLRKHGYRENADPEEYTIKRLTIADFLKLNNLEINCSDIPKHA